jgi:superfamily II DNA helicase RecQ
MDQLTSLHNASLIGTYITSARTRDGVTNKTLTAARFVIDEAHMIYMCGDDFR